MHLNNLNVAIIGHGFVGKAIDECFPDVNKLIVDIKYETKVSDLVSFKADIIFIALPTPMNDNGHINDEIIVDVFNEINKYEVNSVLVLKSTATPNTIRKLSNINDKLVYSPEFLREKSALEDLINSRINILSGSIEQCRYVQRIFNKFSIIKNTEFQFTDYETASMLKYSINAFLASKVIFFNQLKEIFDSDRFEGCWDSFLDLISLDPRLSNSHMKVPGHDGKKGYGGACFPKDVSALIKYAEDIDVNLSLLKEVHSSNNLIRSEYDKSDREISQNINFKNKE